MVEIGSTLVKFELYARAFAEDQLERAKKAGVQGVMVVYDITQPQSFENARRWLHNVEQHDVGNLNMVGCVVGCKSDLVDSRAVSYEDASTFAREHGIQVLETSAKANQGVEEAFIMLALRIKESGQTVRVPHVYEAWLNGQYDPEPEPETETEADMLESTV